MQPSSSIEYIRQEDGNKFERNGGKYIFFQRTLFKRKKIERNIVHKPKK